MIIFYLFTFALLGGVAPSRLRRFLNAEVHNRIDVLSTSQQEHTNWLKYMSIGIIGLLLLILVLLILVLILCHRSRLRANHTTSSIHGSSFPHALDLTSLNQLFRTFSPPPESNPHPFSPPLNYPRLTFWYTRVFLSFFLLLLFFLCVDTQFFYVGRYVRGILFHILSRGI